MTILKEKKINLDKFNEIYSKDRFLARIYGLEKQPHVTSTILNEVSPTNFQIFFERKAYGVSKTLRRYSSAKSLGKIFVNDGKFYTTNNTKKIFPLCLCNLDKDLFELFKERFTWIRFLEECQFITLPFNTVVRHRLYSREKVLKHLYKVPLEKAVQVQNSKIDKKEWNKILKSSINAENLNIEHFENIHFLYDTCNLAWKLNEKVNLAWSTRRLREEHDKWSKVFTKYVIEMDNEPLNNRLIFKDFNDFIGGGLITQSGELAQEGYNQKHCVASYKSSVNAGSCAIFHIEGYTVQLDALIPLNTISVSQVRGIRNCSAPQNLLSELNKKVQAFNELSKNKTYPTHSVAVEEENDYLELPF